MNKEFKRLVMEIISLTLFLVVIVPICVNASSRYKEQKEVLLNGVGTNVDITNKGDMKKVTIYSNYDRVMKVNLIMKTSKFLNDYEIYFDNQVYDIDELEYSDDGLYMYYKLGIYDVDKSREFDFKLRTKGNVYYDEIITYSFMTEGLL